jgi:hypothetical protein
MGIGAKVPRERCGDEEEAGKIHGATAIKKGRYRWLRCAAVHAGVASRPNRRAHVMRQTAVGFRSETRLNLAYRRANAAAVTQ